MQEGHVSLLLEPEVDCHSQGGKVGHETTHIQSLVEQVLCNALLRLQGATLRMQTTFQENKSHCLQAETMGLSEY